MNLWLTTGHEKSAVIPAQAGRAHRFAGCWRGNEGHG
jgi:hypothetical protein